MIDEIKIFLTLYSLLQATIKGSSKIKENVEGQIYKWILNKSSMDKENYYVVELEESRVADFISLRGDFFFEATGMTLDSFRERYYRCPQAFKCVFKKNQKNNTNELVGYYIILPITKKCLHNINNDSITTGRNIRIEDIAKDFSDRFASVYVSAVCGNNLFNQAVTTTFLREELSDIGKKKRIDTMYVRPTTSAGRAAFKTLTGKRCNTTGKIEAFSLNSEETRKSIKKRIQKEKKTYHRKAKRDQQKLRNYFINNFKPIEIF